MNYYYLVAGLPMLCLGREPPIGEGDFLAVCRDHLEPADLLALESLMRPGGGECGHAFVTEWRQRETRLRNAVARVRADRRGVEAEPYLRPEEGYDPSMIRAVDEAFGRATPAEREQELDRFRWQTLESMAGLNPFSTASVLAYGLRLKIVHRWARLSSEAGRRQLEMWVTKAAAASP